jgi:aminopeptidase N
MKYFTILSVFTSAIYGSALFHHHIHSTTYFTKNITGLSNYLKKYAYGNTVTRDLWDCLQESWDEDDSSSGLSVQQIMDTWTRQKGFPLVTVTKRSPGNFVLTQERFLADAEKSSTAVEECPSPT